MCRCGRAPALLADRVRCISAMASDATAGRASSLAARAAAHTSLEDPDAVALLLAALRAAGATGQVAALLDRDPAALASVEDPAAAARLLRVLDEAGAIGNGAAAASRKPLAG
jgi:hypothetical protein